MQTSKEVNLKMIINSGEAKPVAPLGPTLGQYQINIAQFCNEFNAKTQNMIVGIPLIVKVVRHEDKEYTMTIKKPSVSFMLDQFAQDGSIRAQDLFDVIKLNSFFLDETIMQSAFSVFGSLGSKKLKVII